METPKKTWSREVSVLMLIFLGYLAIVGSTATLQILVWPFMLFVTAAFGFKQDAIVSIMSRK